MGDVKDMVDLLRLMEAIMMEIWRIMLLMVMEFM